MSIWKNDMGYLRGGWVVAIITGGVVAFIMALFLFLIIPVSRVACRNTAETMGLPWRYAFTTDCLVQYQGRWVPLDQVRLFEEGRR